MRITTFPLLLAALLASTASADPCGRGRKDWQPTFDEVVRGASQPEEPALVARPELVGAALPAPPLDLADYFARAEPEPIRSIESGSLEGDAILELFSGSGAVLWIGILLVIVIVPLQLLLRILAQQSRKPPVSPSAPPSRPPSTPAA